MDRDWDGRGWDHMGDWWVAIPMIILVLVVIAAAVWVVVALVRQGTAPGQGPAQAGLPPAEPASGAERILAERLARGEIDVDEYNARAGALRGPGPPG